MEMEENKGEDKGSAEALLALKLECCKSEKEAFHLREKLRTLAAHKDRVLLECCKTRLSLRRSQGEVTVLRAEVAKMAAESQAQQQQAASAEASFRPREAKLLADLAMLNEVQEQDSLRALEARRELEGLNAEAWRQVEEAKVEGISMVERLTTEHQKALSEALEQQSQALRQLRETLSASHQEHVDEMRDRHYKEVKELEAKLDASQLELKSTQLQVEKTKQELETQKAVALQLCENSEHLRDERDTYVSVYTTSEETGSSSSCSTPPQDCDSESTRSGSTMASGTASSSKVRATVDCGVQVDLTQLARQEAAEEQTRDAKGEEAAAGELLGEIQKALEKAAQLEAAVAANSDLLRRKDQLLEKVEQQEQDLHCERQKVEQLEVQHREALQQAELWRSDAEAVAQQLQASQDRLSSIRKDLADLCRCPISFKLMHRPMIGSDLRTYEKEVIEMVLDTTPSSPFTRAPMWKALLRPNMLAADLLGLVVKHFAADLEEEISVPAGRPEAVGDELVWAICEGHADEALELLGRDVDPKTLNMAYEYESRIMSLLQVSLCRGLPEVALAILQRPDFKRTETYSQQGLLPLHMAAAYGFSAVCRAILEDCPYLWASRTQKAAVLVAPCGKRVEIPVGSRAVDCCRLSGRCCDWVPEWLPRTLLV